MLFSSADAKMLQAKKLYASSDHYCTGRTPKSYASSAKVENCNMTSQIAATLMMRYACMLKWQVSIASMHETTDKHKSTRCCML